MERHAITESMGEERVFEEIVRDELGGVHQYRSDLLSAPAYTEKGGNVRYLAVVLLLVTKDPLAGPFCILRVEHYGSRAVSRPLSSGPLPFEPE
jgi:hypothetical protein